MISDEAITSVIGELEEAIAAYDADPLAFVPGISGILKEAVSALRQLTTQDGVESYRIMSDDGTSLVLRGNPQDEIILTHLVVKDSGLTECCGVPPFELPSTDRMTGDPTQSTCGGTT